MNDVSEPLRGRPTIVRPRDAASLIVLRGAGHDLEVLAGRRPASVKFMPGVWVFPGGALDPEDRRQWHNETGGAHLTPRLVRCARAALRETWEEAGVVVGRRDPAAAMPDRPGMGAVERAYAQAGVVPAFDALVYVGRAITPTRVFRRFNTRFFLADGSSAFGDPASSDELEDVGWHPIGRRPLAPFRDVSQFMLARAVALRAGSAPREAPLFYTVGGKRRIQVCREAVPGL
ncbi:MAG TPA: NUDIX domain-containing protein [Stellaceae bacterium]|nr:NUDIX domain-containing protein [Stellaceae bacterium]